MLVIVIALIGLAIYGIYDGTMDVREVVVPVILWAIATALALFAFKSEIGAIIATAVLGIYFVMKIFGGDIIIPRH